MISVRREAHFLKVELQRSDGLYNFMESFVVVE